MKLTKRGKVLDDPLSRAIFIKSRFAAEAQCSADTTQP